MFETTRASFLFRYYPGGWDVVSKLTRVLGIAIVLIMLLGSIGNVAVAQQGAQTGTSTQSGAQQGPAQAEPALEPVVEEPVVEEVVVEEPVVEQAAVQETVVEEVVVEETVAEEAVVEEPAVETAAQAPAAQSQSQQAPANAQTAQAPVVEQAPVNDVAPATTEQTITTSATNQTRARAQGGNRGSGTTAPRPQAPPPSTAPKPTPKPPTGNGGGTVTGPISVVVDLSQQMAYVYSGGKVIRSTAVNTGKRGFETPTGTFYINSKYRYDDMRGREGGEAWDVRNVPYAMYFTNRGHALHGAPWARSFGSPRSHGCVNLPMDFAAWLFNNSKIGTKVIVQR